MKKNILKICFSILMYVLIMMLSGCAEEELAQGETYEKKDIPVAANANEAVRENGGSNIKETKASHEYDSVDAKDGNTLVIGEKLFLTQINDIFNNFQRYDGKTIVVEGMLGNYTEWDNSMQNAVVYRNGPGCCGNDGWGGFYLSDMVMRQNGKSYVYNYKNKEDVEIDDWIRVTGKPALYEGTDTEGTKHRYLFLEVEKLENFKDKNRGAEYVAN